MEKRRITIMVVTHETIDAKVRPIVLGYSEGLSSDDLTDDTRIDSTGIDSVDVLSILEKIDEAFATKLGLTEADFDNVVTYGEFVTLVTDKLNAAA